MAKVVLPEKPVFNFTYKIDGRGWVIRSDDILILNRPKGNICWQMYQDWLAEGNKPTIEDPILVEDLIHPFGINLERIDRGPKNEHADKK